MKPLAVVLAALTLAACGSASAGDTQPRALTATEPATQVDKVIVFVIENRSAAQIKASAPYITSLGSKYGIATSLFASCNHPSLPNYIGLSSGSCQGIKDDAGPSSHKLKVPSIFSTTLAAGGTWRIYVDGAFKSCPTANRGPMAVRHTMSPYYVNEHAACLKYDVDLAALYPDITAGTLPDVGFVIPHNGNNAHDDKSAKGLKKADDWIKAKVAKIQAGPDWLGGHLAIVITADEDSKKDGNRIPAVVAFPALHGKTVTTKLTAYSLSAFLSRAGGASPLAGAKTAPDMAAAFGLTVQ